MKKFYLASVGLAAIACVSLVGCGPYQLSPSEKDTTELGALKFATALGGTFVGCSGQDSDGDKYVTCTVKLPDATIKEILCAYNSAGCKEKH